MKNKSAWFWIYLTIFVLYSIGFVVSYFRENAVDMIWYGVLALLWWSMTNRESEREAE